MEKILENKVAIVTGGASGMGKAGVELFSKSGCISVIADINDQEAIKIVEEINYKGDHADFFHTDVTNSKNVARKSELLRNHGLSRTLVNRNNAKKPWDYDIITHGYNYRLDEIRSRLGISQILRSKKIRSKRIGAAKYYNKKLPNDDCIEVVNLDRESEHSYHLYIIRIKQKSKISRNSLHEKLFKSGIKTTVHYKPLHMFSYFKKLKINPKDFPLSENAYTECLTLPLLPTITRSQQDFVIKNIQKHVY